MPSERTINPQMLLEHAGFVRAAARAAIGRDDEVEDAVQDTWTTALAKGPREPRSLRRWLGTVARNRALDIVRARGRVRGREQRAARAERMPSAAAVVERAETGRILIEAVMALPERYRVPILLRYYDGLPPRRIGQELGIPTETARTRVKRGLERLRTAIDERHGGDRGRWSLLLSPLVHEPAPAGVAALALGLGMVIMKKTALIAIVLMAGVAVWQLGHDGGSPTNSPEGARPSGADVESEPGLARPSALGASLDAGATGPAALQGVVPQAGLPIAAAIEVRRLGGSSTSSRGLRRAAAHHSRSPGTGLRARGPAAGIVALRGCGDAARRRRADRSARSGRAQDDRRSRGLDPRPAAPAAPAAPTLRRLENAAPTC